MSTLIQNTAFLFGMTAQKPDVLPAGWEYREASDDWLRCVSPAGLKYVVCTDGIKRVLVNERSSVRLGDLEPFPVQ